MKSAFVRWNALDGIRSTECARPQGYSQLENVSMEAIFDLITVQVIAFVKGQIAFTKNNYQSNAARRWFRPRFRPQRASL